MCFVCWSELLFKPLGIADIETGSRNIHCACFPPKRPRSACHVVPHPWARIPLSKDHLPTANYPSPKFAWPNRPMFRSRHVNMTAFVMHPSSIPFSENATRIFSDAKGGKTTQTWQGEVIPLTPKGSNPLYSNMTCAKCTAVIYFFSFFEHGRHITTWNIMNADLKTGHFAFEALRSTYVRTKERQCPPQEKPSKPPARDNQWKNVDQYPLRKNNSLPFENRQTPTEKGRSRRLNQQSILEKVIAGLCQGGLHLEM